MVDAADTVSVTATVRRVERVERGRLLALAEIGIEIAGVEILLHGVRIMRTGPRSRAVLAPCYRAASGLLVEAVTLPPELAIAVANAVLDEHHG